jgi:ABC-2 type transport system permease protein
MRRLAKIDFRKYFYNRTFWVLSALYLILQLFVFVVTESFMNHIVAKAGAGSAVTIPPLSLYSFPSVWHNLSFLAGFFKIFLALIVIIFITNEFSFKTIRQNVMSGMSRVEFLFSKVIFVFFVALSVSVVLFLSALLLGFFHTQPMTSAMVFSKMYFVAAYFLEVFAFLLFALLFAFLMRKQGLTIGLFAVYYYILEPIISYRLPEGVARFLPIKMITHLIDVPNSSLMKIFGMHFRETVSLVDIAGCIAYSVLFVLLAWLTIKNRDL